MPWRVSAICGLAASVTFVSVVWFLWLALVAFRLLRVSSEPRSAAAPG